MPMQVTWLFASSARRRGSGVGLAFRLRRRLRFSGGDVFGGRRSALGLVAVDFAVSTAMLLRNASMMLMTLGGRVGCSVTFAGSPPAWCG